MSKRRNVCTSCDLDGSGEEIGCESTGDGVAVDARLEAKYCVEWSPRAHRSLHNDRDTVSANPSTRHHLSDLEEITM